jgi:hypothetical protein
MALIGDVAARGDAEKQVLGAVMAGNLARDLGGFTKDGMRPMSYLKGLATGKQPSWYTQLAETTKAHAAAGQMPAELFDVRASSRVVATIADDAAAALATVDRSAMKPAVQGALDDALAKLDASKAAFASAEAGGKLSDEAVAALGGFDASVTKLIDESPLVANRLFPSYVDDVALDAMQVRAGDAVRAEWLATASSGTDEVAETVAGLADDAAGAVIGPMHGPMTAVAAAAEGARAVNAPVKVAAGTSGMAFPQQGPILEPWTSLGGAAIPRNVNDPSIARLAAALQAMRA